MPVNILIWESVIILLHINSFTRVVTSHINDRQVIRDVRKIMPFVLDSIVSISLVKILSISVAVCCVILDGLNTGEIYYDVDMHVLV